MEKPIEEYTFKESVLAMYELIGLGSLDMEYEELPGVVVTLSLEEKEND